MQHFSRKDVEILHTEESYQGFFRMLTLKLRHRLFGGGWSGDIKRELFARGDAAAAILYDPVADTIGFIEQFRVGALNFGLSPWCMEVVAGMIDAGESAEQTIRRELIEEADFAVRELLPICHYLSSPGGTDESVHLFCALGDLTKVGGIHGLEHESEDIKVHVLPAQEVLDALYQPAYANAATVIALQWLAAKRLELRRLKW